jgi:hypothetical protein
MGYLEPSTSQNVIYGILILLGFGSGMTFLMGFSVSTLKVKPSDIGNVISFQDVCQLGSSTITLVIAGQVFQSRTAANLEQVLAGKASPLSTTKVLLLVLKAPCSRNLVEV